MTTYDLDGFTVSVATLDDWPRVTEWGNGEGWNIGYQDPACFLPIDPEGFFIGRVGDRPVSAVSLVNYSDQYAVWGHYLVDPELRGKGYGQAVCKVATRHSGDRVTAGDAMPEQVANYSRDGSAPVYHTINYVGRPRPTNTTAEPVVRVGPEHLDAIAAYDAECFPAYRRGFLSRWLYADGHVAYARLRDGEVVGYGVIRPAPLCRRIGPLSADTPADAEALFDALIGHLEPGGEVSVFAPDAHTPPGELFTRRGLAERFRVVRMYRGTPPKHRTECVYAIGSLELG